MNFKDKIKEVDEAVEKYLKLKEAFTKPQTPANIKFDLAELKDGTPIGTETDAPFTVGDKVFVQSADGSVAPAPDGKNELKDGRVIVVANGLITEITPAPQGSTPATDANPAAPTSTAPSTQANKTTTTTITKIVEPINQVITEMKDENKTDFSVQLKSIEDKFTAEIKTLTDKLSAISLLQEKLNKAVEVIGNESGAEVIKQIAEVNLESNTKESKVMSESKFIQRINKQKAIQK